MLEFKGKVRIEEGPAKLTAIATPELLDDAVTLSHYAVGKPDALNKPIVLGEEMTYLDWKSKFVHKVYVLVDGTWTYDSEHAEQNAAINRAIELV